MYQRLYSDWHVGHAWNQIKLVFGDTVKTERNHYFYIRRNPEWFGYRALRNDGCTYLLPSVAKERKPFIAHPPQPGVLHPKQWEQDILSKRVLSSSATSPGTPSKKRKNLILYKTDQLVLINDLRKHLGLPW